MSETVTDTAVKILHHLYNCDILSEEMLLKWHSNVPDGVDQLQEREKLRKQVSAYDYYVFMYIGFKKFRHK